MTKLVSSLLAAALVWLAGSPALHAQKPDDKKATAPAAPAKPVAAPAAPAPPTMAPAPPPPGSPPPAPKPASELDQFKFFVGKWKCDGKQFAGPLGPEHTFKATADDKMDGDGFFQHWIYEEKKSKEHMGARVHGMWGWDAGTKKFTRVAADNRGNWDIASSPGLEGDKIVWNGDLSGPMGKTPFRSTFTKKGDKEFMFSFEIRSPDGKWANASEVTCKK